MRIHPRDFTQDPDQGRIYVGLKVTSPTPRADDPELEARNQAILQQHGLARVWVTRDAQGRVTMISGEYPNGEPEVIFHGSSGQDPHTTTSSVSAVTREPGTSREHPHRPSAETNS